MESRKVCINHRSVVIEGRYGFYRHVHVGLNAYIYICICIDFHVRWMFFATSYFHDCGSTSMNVFHQ